ncbi:MAG: phosphopyruvate hydratase [Thermoproteota archaeon]|jgi:enolase
MELTIIQNVNNRIIFDSRGDQTVETVIETKVSKGIASCPSGASRSSYEVQNVPKIGLLSALKNFNEVKKKLISMDSLNQKEIDEFLLKSDGTQDLSNFGAVIILSTSIANLKAAANSLNIPYFKKIADKEFYKLPIPLGNIIGGGKHAKGKSIDIQEVLVFCTNANNIFESIKANVLLHRKVAEILSRIDPYFSGKNDENAWVTSLGIKKSLDIIKEAIKYVKEKEGFNFKIGLDVAASSLWNEEKKVYEYKYESFKLSEEQQLKFISNLIEEYDIWYIEDPFHENSFEYFSELLNNYKERLIVGDDLYASNVLRLKEGIRNKSTNGIIIKPNQVGCLTRLFETIEYAKNNNVMPIVSHRSGETEDAFISHLATAIEAPLIKTGTIGGERVSKLNELIRIEEILKEKANINDFVKRFN